MLKKGIKVLWISDAYARKKNSKIITYKSDQEVDTQDKGSELDGQRS